LTSAILARLAKVCPLEESKPMVKHGHALLGREGFPIVLVEAGFLSNREEAARLQTAGYRRLLAGAIADGIRDYLRGRMKIPGRDLGIVVRRLGQLTDR